MDSLLDLVVYHLSDLDDDSPKFVSSADLLVVFAVIHDADSIVCNLAGWADDESPVASFWRGSLVSFVSAQEASDDAVDAFYSGGITIRGIVHPPSCNTLRERDFYAGFYFLDSRV